MLCLIILTEVCSGRRTAVFCTAFVVAHTCHTFPAEHLLCADRILCKRQVIVSLMPARASLCIMLILPDSSTMMRLYTFFAPCPLVSGVCSFVLIVVFS